MKARWCCADGTGGRRATAAARGERWAYLKLEIRGADSQNLSWNCRWRVIRDECACFKWPNLTSCGMISMFKQVSTSPLAYDEAPNPRNRWFVVRGERVFGRWRTEDGGKKVSRLSPSPPPFTCFYPALRHCLQVFVLGPHPTVEKSAAAAFARCASAAVEPR